MYTLSGGTDLTRSSMLKSIKSFMKTETNKLDKLMIFKNL